MGRVIKPIKSPLCGGKSEFEIEMKRFKRLEISLK